MSVPPWIRSMTDAGLPSTWSDAARSALDNSLWILPLVTIERLLDDHFYQASFVGACWIMAMVIAVKLHVVQDAFATRERRHQIVTWGLIIFGALALGAGIFRLANSKQSQEESNNRQLQAERESRVALDRQLGETRKELEDTKQQLNAARQRPQPSPSAPQPNTERVIVGESPATREQEKTIGDITPEYLFGLYENKTKVQGDASASIYIGKLIRFHGSVQNISQFKDGSVRVYSNLSGKLVTMEFDEGKDASTVSTFSIGRGIDVLGQIVTVGSLDLTLLKCSLLES